MNKLFVNNIGDLAEAQRASFYRFLFYGISEELSTFTNPFVGTIWTKSQKLVQCLIYLYPNEIKLKGPYYSISTCLKRDLSYSIQLYIPGEYSYSEEKSSFDIENEISLRDKNNISKNSKIRKIQLKQDIFFGEIPLMTDEGTFIINGCERVVISQIIRSPGIYFKKEFNPSRKTIYTATIISNRGLWTKFILNEKTLVETFIETLDKNNNKTDAQTFKEGTDQIYIQLADYKGKPLQAKENDFDSNRLHIYDLIRYFGLSFEEISDSLKYPLHLLNHQHTAAKRSNFQEIFLLIRKLFFNQRSGCFSIGEIGRYKINKRLGLNLPKDITYLSAHDFLAIIDGLVELKYYDRGNDDIDDIRNKQIRSVGELLQNQIRVGLYRLRKKLLRSRDPFTVLEKIDLGAYWWIIDPKPVTSSLKEFFTTSQLSQFMDQTNPLAELTHKRRISVFGPNGLKRDHISTVIRDIHPSQYGRLCPIETPEGSNAGLIASLAMYGRISSLGSIETPYFLLKNGTLFSEKQAIYLNPEQESETTIGFCDTAITKESTIKETYLSAKENYLFSLKKTKEVNLITMSPLQIVSLATALIPFLEHNDANRALMGSNMQRQAVPLLYAQKAIVGTGLEAAAILDSQMVIKTYSEGQVEFASSQYIKIRDCGDQKIKYYLKKYWRSNQETCINQKPIVWSQELVFSGQIIADGPSSNDGELALGYNLIIGYMPWEGYNYEDAIVINERVILEDCLTSIHIEEHETSLVNCANGNEKLTNKLPYLTKYIRRHLNKDGIIKIGSYVKEQDILVGKLTPCEPDNSPQARLLRAVYKIKEEITYRDTSLRVPHGTEGRVIDIRILSTTLGSNDEPLLSSAKEIIKIYIGKIRKIQVGDKLSGRHGNKGIISRILTKQDMPYLPDGTPVDILFNPLGVPSRMNVGQVFECLLGLAGEKLGKRFKVFPFDEIYGKEASRVLVNQKLKEVAKNSRNEWIFNSSSPGKILLRDGRTGEYFDNPITVGKSYILKLIHLVEDKIHARATGPYAMITEQPLAGKSQKGGQRFGEMETWALEAYGCSNTLQELLTIKSDDIDGRNDMYESLLVRREMEKPNPSIPEAFLVLIRELNALGLDFCIQKIENQFENTPKLKQIEKNIFEDLENKLKLRALLFKKKSERFGNWTAFSETNDQRVEEKKTKSKIREKFQQTK